MLYAERFLLVDGAPLNRLIGNVFWEISLGVWVDPHCTFQLV